MTRSVLRLESWSPVLVAKSLLYSAGINEEKWETEDIIFNTALFAITAGLDLYTVYDAFQPSAPSSRNTQIAVDVIKRAPALQVACCWG